MLPRLKRRFSAIEQQRSALVTALRGHDPEALAFKPAPESWSVVEVVEHLVIAEELSLKALEKPLPPDRGSLLRSTFRINLIRGAFRYLSVRVKAPSARLMPTGTAALSDLLNRWDAARTRLGMVVEAITPATRSERRWRHPLAGWLTTEQWLAFIYSHVAHHQKQMGRIWSARQVLTAR